MTLTEARRERGWTKSELGRRSRIALPDICRLEAGKIYPYPGWRRRLSEALNVPAEELFKEVINDGNQTA